MVTLVREMSKRVRESLGLNGGRKWKNRGSQDVAVARLVLIVELDAGFSGTNGGPDLGYSQGSRLMALWRCANRDGLRALGN